MSNKRSFDHAFVAPASLFPRSTSGRHMYPSSNWGRTYSKPTAATLAKYGSHWDAASANQRGHRIVDKYYGRGKYGGRGLYEGAGYAGRGKYRGRGNFWNDLEGFGKGFVKGFTHTAEKLANVVPKLAGLGKIFKGSGNYVSANSLITNSGGVSADVPTFHTSGDETGALTITHREYVRDIFGNDADDTFVNRALPINPGLQQTFPWLSQLACNYEEYDLVQCIFTFRSTCENDVNSNGQVGTVVMATNYNPNKAPWADKTVMMQYDGAKSDKTTATQLQGVECDPAKLSGSSGKYVRSHVGLASHENLGMYDHGLFQLATSGLPPSYANESIGELWVSYTITLRKPKFYSGLGLAIQRDVFSDVSNLTIATDICPFIKTNLGATQGLQNNIGCIITAAEPISPPVAGYGYFKITFPAYVSGTFAITVNSTCTDGTSVASVAPLSLSLNQFDPAFGITGQVQLVQDMYGSPAPYTSVPYGLAIAGAASWATGTYDANFTGTIGMRGFNSNTLHVRVSVADAGVDNTVICAYKTLSDTGLWSTASVDIQEYNHYSNLMLPPIMVNSTGTVASVP